VMGKAIHAPLVQITRKSILSLSQLKNLLLASLPTTKKSNVINVMFVYLCQTKPPDRRRGVLPYEEFV